MIIPHSSQGRGPALDPFNGAIVLAAVAAIALSMAGCGVDPGPEVIPKPASPKKAASVDADELPSVRFTDVTEEAGIDFHHHNAATGEKLLPETMGSGVAAIDYDSDGNADLLFVNQRPWPGDSNDPDAPPPTPALYRNDGSWHFEDVTSEAGLDQSLFGMGAVVGDIDNDGDPDLYLTTVSGGRLFRNDDAQFVDVTQSAGAGAGDAWLTSGAFFDLENDGDLDLFLCAYVEWSADFDRSQSFQLTGAGRAYGPPTAFRGSYCVLLRNDGDGTFTDISEAAGIRLETPELKDPMAKSLGVAPFDIDGDGYVDLAVANDTVRNFLFHNLGDGTFEELGIVSGVAFDQAGQVRGAMGIDWAPLPQRPIPRPGHRQFRQRDDRPLRRRRPEAAPVHRPGEPLRARLGDATALEIRALLLRL